MAEYTKDQIETARRQKTVTVASHDQYDCGPFNFGGFEDGTLSAVMSSLEDIRNSIPEEYRDTASCRIDGTSYYDSVYASIEVEYDRPETDEEVLSRLREDEACKFANEAAERRQFEVLRAKFEKMAG